jgi:hypothetical protein
MLYLQRNRLVSKGDEPSGPCALIVVSNIDKDRNDQKEQEFYCHFGCFRRLVNNDGILYIMEPDHLTIG